MKKNVFLTILIISAAFLSAEIVEVFPELLKPESIMVDNSQIYITEGVKIHIHSLGDYKKIKSFGKEGGGPQEFKVLPQLPLQIDITSSRIIVNSQGKVSFWKKDGSYISEKKVQFGIFTGFFKPLEDGFVGTRFITENNVFYFGVDFYDKDFKRGTLLFKQKHFFQQGKKMDPLGRLPFFSTAKGKVYIEDNKGRIHVFDKTGKEFQVIDHKFEQLKLNDKHKKAILDWYKTDPRFKQFWEFFKNNIEFPADFPNIQLVTLADDLLYMQTYQRNNGESEFIIYDLEGKFISKNFYPFRDKNIIEPSPYTIRGGKMYQLVENEDEEWELHIRELKN